MTHNAGKRNIGSNVTQCGEISPLWQQKISLWQFLDGLLSIWQFLDGLLSIWQNFEPTYFG